MVDDRPFRELPMPLKALIVAFLLAFYGAFFYLSAVFYGWLPPPNGF